MQKAEYSVLEIQEGTEKRDQMSGSLLGPIPSTRSTPGHLKRLNGGSLMCSSPSQGFFSAQNGPALNQVSSSRKHVQTDPCCLPAPYKHCLTSSTHLPQ